MVIRVGFGGSIGCLRGRGPQRGPVAFMGNMQPSWVLVRHSWGICMLRGLPAKPGFRVKPGMTGLMNVTARPKAAAVWMVVAANTGDTIPNPKADSGHVPNGTNLSMKHG